MDVSRYHRQVLLPQIGADGQGRLLRARVLLIGCGALGGVVAEQLVRAGVGMLRIVDRDVVEMSNLQRQVLFDEQDAVEQAPKAVAAARRLCRINSQVRIDPIVADLNPTNIEQFAGLTGSDPAADLIIDGTDNAETRYLINDVSVKHGKPWIYGACVGVEGRFMAIAPPLTACLRCLFPQPPEAGELPTCDTAGVLASAAAVVGSLQVTAAMQLLLGRQPPRQMTTFDLWSGRFHAVSVEQGRRPDCVCCGKRQLDFLDSRSAGDSTSLCGRNAVQILPPRGSVVNLDVLAGKLANVGEIEKTPYLLRCALREPREVRLMIFPDGRAIVQGLNDRDRAKSLYAKFVGN